MAALQPVTERTFAFFENKKLTPVVRCHLAGQEQAKEFQAGSVANEGPVQTAFLMNRKK
jgi:hypothetical protein